MMIPERLFRILRLCEREDTSSFPATEVFNEGWMLRLVLDAIQALDGSGHPLRFLSGAKWYSEARLSSPFRPQSKKDALGEGFTKADGVIGHFEFHPSTKTGLSLNPGGRQFIVVEAKMFSNLSSRTKNAPEYNQAARTVACMAAAIAQSKKSLSDLESVGFFVIAPDLDYRSQRDTNLEACLNPESIGLAVNQRIAAYEAMSRQKEFDELRKWEKNVFLPLVSRLVSEGRLGVLSWENVIEEIGTVDPGRGDELLRFYKHCLTLGRRVLDSSRHTA